MRRYPSEFNFFMHEIIDHIYEVFEQLNQAKSVKDEILVLQKEIELERLRKDLVKASKTRGCGVISSGTLKK